MEKAKKPNLFSSLYRWAHSGSENFCTEALVWLINQFLDKGELAGKRLLSLLCFGEEDLDKLGEDIEVLTQFRTVHRGIPDILIKTTKLLAIIEVKVGAGLGENQLTEYREYLNEKKGDGEGLLILLEREKTSDSDDESIKDLNQHWRWFEVGDWLRNDDSVMDPAAREMKNEFVEFLEEQHMCLKQVSGAMPEGLSTLMDFNLLLGAVLDENEFVAKKKVNGGQAFSGFWVDLPISRMWVGIDFATPTRMEMYTDAKYPFGEAEKVAFEATDFEVVNGNWLRHFPLDEDFFKSDLVQQKRAISSFVKETFDIFDKVLNGSTGGVSDDVSDGNDGRPGSGEDLRGRDLKGADLSGKDLENANMAGMCLYGTNFNGAKLRNVNLEDADLREANLERAVLVGSNLKGVQLSGAEFCGANLQGVNLEGVALFGGLLKLTNLSGGNLRGTHTKRGDLPKSEVERLLGGCSVNLVMANLQGTDLTGADLKGADLCSAKLIGSNLTDVNLQGARLHGANLHGANLQGSDLRNAEDINLEETLGTPAHMPGEPLGG